jgi:YesN/AraC family two-component response regulator
LLLDIEDDTIALLFNSDKVLENWFEEFAALFLNSFSLLFKETFTVSLGTECENPADLHKGWQNAMILAEYRFVLGKGRCISQKDVKKYEKANVHYPAKKERYIIDSLNLSRKEDVGKAMGVMFEYISKQSVDNAKISMHRLLSMLIREFSRLLAPRHCYEKNTANLFDQLNEFLTVQDACQWMTDMCFEIIDEISPETNDIKQDHINKAIEIIENEYDNPNLSSNLIASKLGLSGSYLREIFGQYTNTFLPKYINDFRCQIGKEMLTKTKLPISVISQKIGIVNTKYFYSLFKKNTGMTPSDYRASNK